MGPASDPLLRGVFRDGGPPFEADFNGFLGFELIEGEVGVGRSRDFWIDERAINNFLEK